MPEPVGPRMSDSQFFTEQLDLDYHGLEAVKEAVSRGDYGDARARFASHVRQRLSSDTCFSTPFEDEQTSYMLGGESVTDAANRICGNHMISCGTPYAFGDRIDWFHNPTYNQYKEWTWQLSRHHEWKLLARVYRSTGDERYAVCFVRQFTSWVEQAVCPGDVPGNETLCWRTIECGIRMGANWPYILYSFYKSPAFSDDVLINWYKSVCEHGHRLRNHFWRANWLIMEMNGLGQTGILYPEFKSAEEWRAFAFRRLSDELDLQIYDDGFQYELSTGYHDVTIKNYQRLIQLAKSYDVAIPPAFLPKLEKAAAVNVKLAMPDGRLPNTNDGSWHSVAAVLKPKMELFPDRQDFRWFVSNGMEGREPDYTSVALPDSGFCVMRDGWGPEATWALLDAAPFGRGHQHEDKLSLLVYTGGRLLVTEAGNYAYDTSEMRKYVLSTRSHNTVLVDGMDQNRRDSYEWLDGDIRKPSGMVYKLREDHDFAEGIYDEGYGPDADRSVTHKRAVYFIKKPANGLLPFFVVADRLYADREHEYEFLWHLACEKVELTSHAALTGDCAILTSDNGDESGFNLIRGQRLPEWQGFVASGGTQGSYVAVPTVRRGIYGAGLRAVTVILPYRDDCPVTGVRAPSSLEDTTVTLLLKNGGTYALDESQLR